MTSHWLSPSIASPISLSRCPARWWSAAWEMTRDAESGARDFVALVSRRRARRNRGGRRPTAAAAGPDRAELLRRAGLGCHRGLAGVRRPPARVGPGCRAGSDHQLAFVNALCASVLTGVHSSHHLVLLADLLDHDPAGYGLPGLVVDTDLRWRIITALAAGGRSTPTDPRRRSSMPNSPGIRPRPVAGTPRRRRRPGRRLTSSTGRGVR